MTHLKTLLGAALLLSAPAMAEDLAPCAAGSAIDLAVTVDSSGQPQFDYSQFGQSCSGDVEVSEAGTITYRLINLEQAPQGLRFVGAGFANPFNGVVDKVEVSTDGKTLQLYDSKQVAGPGKFQFIFSSSENGLLLLSPDPQVINQQDTTFN